MKGSGIRIKVQKKRWEKKNPVKLPRVLMTFISGFTPLSESQLPIYMEFP